MNLYLVQHAEAKSAAEDPERPLSESGLDSLKQMVTFVRQHQMVSVSRIFHSGKTRARQTAEILAEAIKPESGLIEAAGLNPMDDPSEWAERVAGLDEDMMLVGHLPHLSRLTSLLVRGGMDKPAVDFRNAGIVCLRQDISGVWSIGWMVTPEILA